MKMKKLLAMFMIVATASSMTACKTNSDRKYVCRNNRDSVITINKSSTDTRGSGNIKKGWEPYNRVYSITGNFRYSADKVIMTTGTFNAQTFDDVDVSNGAESIIFNGLTYRYE